MKLRGVSLRSQRRLLEHLPNRQQTVVLKANEGYGPYAIKGIGEHSNAQTAPAIVNAIEDAVGVRIRDLPATAERVYRALQEA